MMCGPVASDSRESAWAGASLSLFPPRNLRKLLWRDEGYGGGGGGREKGGVVRLCRRGDFGASSWPWHE